MQASVECLNFSGAVLVARKGKEVFRAGYGKADRLNIKLEKSRLFVEGIGEKAIEIFAESETEYFIDEFDAQISFCKTGKKVSYLLLHQGGSTSKAKRLGLEV